MRLCTALLISSIVFVGGCTAIYFLHAEMSEVPIIAYAVVALTALAGLLWPLFFAKALTRWVDSLK